MSFFKNCKTLNSNKNSLVSKSHILYYLIVMLVFSSCSGKLDYSPEFMEQTSGRYLFNQENTIDVYYENNKLYLNWSGLKVIEPIVLDDHSFFVPEVYKKLQFVQHPETKKRYLSVVSDEDNGIITYDYLKVDKDYKTPSMHLDNGDYKKALEGYIKIKEQDSTSAFLDEGKINSLGYRFLREQEFDNAVEVFKMNVALFPESSNVFDSLADGYLAQGDSLNAFVNFKKTLELNNNNRKAKDYVEAFNQTKD